MANDSGGLSIGVLSGQINLDNNFTATITISEQALDQLEKRFGSTHDAAAHVAEGMVVAEAALEAVKEAAHLLAEGLADITIEGAKVADVEQNFNRLTLAAGDLGDELLGTLKKGTHDTITDFELMKSVNDNLAAGVKLTDENYKTLATGAFALAQAKGIEVKTAFDDINFALETGKVKTVQYLTGKLDLAAAEDKLAAKLGTTADKLSAEEKQEAARAEILDKVAASTARLGEQQDGLDEKVAQAGVAWHNFMEDLGKTVATSPAMLQAFDEIKQILGDAFGTDKEQLIKNIADVIVGLTQDAVEVVRVGVEVVQFMNDWKDVLEPVAVGLGAIGVSLVAVAAGEKAIEAASAFWLALTPEIIAVGVAAAAVYAAFEIGKWRPVSDFFEKLGLVTFGHMTSAEADAAIAAEHLAEEQNAAAKAADAHGKSAEKVAMTLKDAKEIVEGLVPEVTKYAEQLLTAGKGTETVATETGLTVTQVKALQVTMADTAKSLDDASKSNAIFVDGIRLSKQEFKQYVESWKELNSIGLTYEDTLKGINPTIVESVKYYAQAGASVKDLTAAFPGLTKAQAEAAVASVKAAQDIDKVWMQVAEIEEKMHGDNVNDWLALETKKYDTAVKMLESTGKATEAALDAEAAKFDATISAEIKKREEQDQYSKQFYEKQVEVAKNALDLMLADSGNHTEREIQIATQEYTDKQRLLEHWAQDVNDKLDGVTKAHETTATKSVTLIDSMTAHWRSQTDAINEATIKVKMLSGEIVSLEEAQRRFDMGGSFDVSKANFDQTLAQMGLSAGAGENLARQGYSLAEIVSILHGGPAGPPRGPRIPGFDQGGYGDFGTGTLAMLHGKEIITPVDKLGGMGTTNLTFNVYGNTVQQVQQIKDILMRELKSVRQFPSA